MWKWLIIWDHVIFSVFLNKWKVLAFLKKAFFWGGDQQHFFWTQPHIALNFMLALLALYFFFFDGEINVLFYSLNLAELIFFFLDWLLDCFCWILRSRSTTIYKKKKQQKEQYTSLNSIENNDISFSLSQNTN